MQEIRQALEVSDQSDAVHQEQNGIESFSLDGIEITLAGIPDSAATHHGDRLVQDVDGRDIDALALEVEGVTAGPGPEIEDAAPAQGKRPPFNLRKRSSRRTIKILHRRIFSRPDIAVNDDRGRGLPFMEIAQRHSEGQPASAEAGLTDIYSGTASNLKEGGPMTRKIGNNPTVSSQKGVRLYHHR